MNRRYEDERESSESQQYGRARHGYRDERYRGGSSYGGTEQGYRGPRGGYGGGWGWSDQVWSGEGRFDEGGIGRGQYGYGTRQYGQGGRSEYDEPRYVGSLNRGERRGEEPYQEHEWQRSKEQPGLLTRLYARGPKGYKRSDERIKEDISERVWRAEYIDSSEVTIAVKDGAVTLSGTVPERWMRHEIENIADNCMGVQDIENSVRVQRPMIGGMGAEMAGARGPGGERP